MIVKDKHLGLAMVLRCFAVAYNAAFALMDEAELADAVEDTGSPASVLKSALVSSCRIACAQSNNINNGNRTAYAVRSLHPKVDYLLQWQKLKAQLEDCDISLLRISTFEWLWFFDVSLLYMMLRLR
ncbi:hypothetical protein cyc_00529 [Cyclospora cayetanensis]|uniref:Uncharacterized protein n=1 Tax=Cyclospora cayetanensis TaxID=88456 RepID=A0A1D3CW04_9EIME|nr:hypothetical protein cyc_00529 [Cyclospora cayetanensis]